MSELKEPSYIGHRKRLKQKYEQNGINGWLDYEILEFILFYAIPRKDTKLIAKRLLSKFKTIRGILDADRKEIESVRGISKNSALFLKLLKDIFVFYMEQDIHERDLLSSPKLVYDYLKLELKGLANEEFKMMFLDSRNQLISMESLKNGTVNRVIVFPRKIVERALCNHTVGVIIAHNHPSGSIEPSVEDQKITETIKEALNTVDIKLLDHIIIGGNKYFSFRENRIVIEKN
jgi:DNA repair protein RadC